jgi:hypothetical protein
MCLEICHLKSVRGIYLDIGPVDSFFWVAAGFAVNLTPEPNCVVH